MINIYLNDEHHQISSNQSLQAFLLQCSGVKAPFAVAINNQFVPQPVYGTTLLYEGDRIDIIVPMQGG
jgi:sulfur carrier protein